MSSLQKKSYLPAYKEHIYCSLLCWFVELSCSSAYCLVFPGSCLCLARDYLPRMKGSHGSTEKCAGNNFQWVGGQTLALVAISV